MRKTTTKTVKAAETATDEILEAAKEAPKMAAKAVGRPRKAPKAAAEEAVEAVKEAPKMAAEKVAEAVGKTKAAVKKAEKATKEAAAKTPAKRTTRSAVAETVYLQYLGKEINKDDVLKQVKEIWTKQLKRKVGEMKSVTLYLKPEENKAYYVINDEVTGSVDL